MYEYKSDSDCKCKTNCEYERCVEEKKENRSVQGEDGFI